MMDTFLRLAKSNTSKNLETCGILAGSLVSSFSRQKNHSHFFSRQSSFNYYLINHAGWLHLDIMIFFVCVCAEEQKILYYSFDNSEAGINNRYRKLVHI